MSVEHHDESVVDVHDSGQLADSGNNDISVWCDMSNFAQ